MQRVHLLEALRRKTVNLVLFRNIMPGLSHSGEPAVISCQ